MSCFLISDKRGRLCTTRDYIQEVMEQKVAVTSRAHFIPHKFLAECFILKFITLDKIKCKIIK